MKIQNSSVTNHFASEPRDVPVAPISVFHGHPEVISQVNDMHSIDIQVTKSSYCNSGHELRNPLGTLRPSFYVCDKKSDRGDKRLQSAIERIDRNIERCDRIIDELLDYTRISVLDRRLSQIDDWLESVIYRAGYS